MIKYEVLEHISTISRNGDNTLELNFIRWGDNDPKYDLRKWKRSEDEERAYKGIALTEDELIALRDALKGLDL
ncbi:MAG TPA: hypothetical protein IAB09_02000 [Candidatus Avilachnospira avicola]|nr:hypothetical protein [Candidatus Avilachnospira avicola]